jgi:8-oxo-dGTP diphosphatase
MIKAKEDIFHLGVKALIRNPNKEILLLERKSKFNKNYWDLPGGRLQKDESLLQTLKREIAEETGLNDIRDAQPFITVLTDIRIQNAEEDVGLIFSVYLCDINYMFSPQLSDEHITFKWLPPYECLKKLKQYPLPFTDKLANLY